MEILEAAQIEQPRARAIAAAIEEAIGGHDVSIKEWMRETFATKADLKELELRVVERIESMRADMESVKSDLTRWMFLFWIGQIAVLGGLIKFLLP